MSWKFNPFTKKLDFTPVTATITDGDTENCPDGNSVYDALALKLTKSDNLSDVANAATAFGNIKQSATTSATGVVELATQAEVLAGTDTSRAVVPVDLWAKTAIDVNPKAFSQAVAMTYAASGSTGITVADDDDIDFGTGNFTLRWKGSLPDWTPSALVTLAKKLSGGGANYYAYEWLLNTDGTLRLYLYRNDNGIAYTSSEVTGLTDGTAHDISCVVTRETASVAGSVVFYIDGVQLGSSRAITAVNPPVTISNTGTLYLMGNTAQRIASVNQAFTLFNRALTAAEVLSLYQSGVATSDQWGSQTAQTSGTLTVGKKYRINTYVSDDDFTNIGGTNVSGNEFIATGTTPTKWTNSSSLVLLGATIDLEPEGIQSDKWYDASTNALNATYPTAGSSFTRRWSWATLPAASNNAAASAVSVQVGGLYRTDADPSLIAVRTV